MVFIDCLWLYIPDFHGDVVHYPMVTIAAPSRTESPFATWIAVTVPACVASMEFSIFIASRTATSWPALTLSPTFTLTAMITPGSGLVTAFPAPEAAGFGAADAAGAV